MYPFYLTDEDFSDRLLDKPSVVGAFPKVPYRKNHVTVPRGRPPKDCVHGRYTRQRWKVERSFAWANRFRRLDRLLEHGQKTYRAFVRAFFVKYYLDLLY